MADWAPPAPAIDPPLQDPTERRALAGDERLLRTVRWRLVAWAGGTTFLVLVVLAVALYLSVARSLESTGRERLDQRASLIRAVLTSTPRDPTETDTSLAFGSGTFGIILDGAGEPIRGPGAAGIPPGLPNEASVEAARTGAPDVRTAVAGDVPVRVRTEEIPTRIGPVFVQVVQDRTAEQQTLDVLLTVLLAGGALVLVAALAFGAMYANRALVPIRDSLAAQRTSLRRQREFAADASHELRTPLTVIRSSLEYLRRQRERNDAAIDETVDDIDAEVAHLTGLVDDLLLLARSDSGAVSLDRLPVDLGDVAADAASALAKPAAAKGVRVEVEPAPVVVVGDGARLRQLVTILVDNAIRHSPSGAAVRVTVRPDGSGAELDVEDQGPGVRPEDMPYVFDRFWRAQGAPSGGTGLGLAIAASIVRGHDGRIEVSNRPEGGARFRVALPLAAAPSA